MTSAPQPNPTPAQVSYGPVIRIVLIILAAICMAIAALNPDIHLLDRTGWFDGSLFLIIVSWLVR